ncbi:MAG: hypothetical protein J6A76_05170 [Oscillospiraceae bacterium]|nr:hypothetical protein [Oscillospiraceae bacterium]
MNCPYCQNEMKKGFIQCRDGVYWTLKKQLIASLSSWGAGSISLANGANESGSAVFAYRCEKCETVIIPPEYNA